MNKALSLLVFSSFLLMRSLAAAPVATLHNGGDREVMIYEFPQEDGVQQWLDEIKNLQGHTLIVESVSPQLLSGYFGDALPTGSLWDLISSDVEYLDTRVIEHLAMMIKEVGSANAMDYLMGETELHQIYQQVWFFSADRAKTLADRYQKLFLPARQQCQQLFMQLQSGGKNPTEREVEAVQTFVKRFISCFVDHLCMQFGVTRKALVAEHCKFMQEIEEYSDASFNDAYKQFISDFKQRALWLQPEVEDELLLSYLRRVDLLDDEDKKNLEAFQKESGQTMERLDLNLAMLTNASLPLVVARALHLIEKHKSVVLVITSPLLYIELVELLTKQGYKE